MRKGGKERERGIEGEKGGRRNQREEKENIDKQKQGGKQREKRLKWEVFFSPITNKIMRTGC